MAITLQLDIPGPVPWSDIIFAASSDKEPFKDMQVVTARSEFITKAREMAVNWLIHNHTAISEQKVDQLAAEFIRNNKIQVFESAQITEDGVFVCLNVDAIDDNAIWTALDMVYQAIENGGVWISDAPLSYPLDDVLNTH